MSLSVSLSSWIRFTILVDCDPVDHLLPKSDLTFAMVTKSDNEASLHSAYASLVFHIVDRSASVAKVRYNATSEGTMETWASTNTFS